MGKHTKEGDSPVDENRIKKETKQIVVFDFERSHREKLVIRIVNGDNLTITPRVVKKQRRKLIN